MQWYFVWYEEILNVWFSTVLIDIKLENVISISE